MGIRFAMRASSKRDAGWRYVSNRRMPLRHERPQAGVRQTFPHRPMRRTDGAHQHPNSTGQKVSGNSGRLRSSQIPLSKNCTPREYRKLAGGAGTRMSALGCGHSAVHLITFPAALRPITPGAACWRSTMRDCCAAEVANFLAIKHAARFNDKVRFYLG